MWQHLDSTTNKHLVFYAEGRMKWNVVYTFIYHLCCILFVIMNSARNTSIKMFLTILYILLIAGLSIYL